MSKKTTSDITYLIPNYIKVTFRNLLKRKAYSLINISGLAVGLTCCFSIILYVLSESSFDSFHSGAENIYRVHSERISPQGNSLIASSPAPAIPLLADEFPQVTSFVRMMPSYGQNRSIRYGEDSYLEPHVIFTDSTVFSVFNFKLLVGDPDEVLKSPSNVVITKATDQRYFGDENPIGKVLDFEMPGGTRKDMTVAGVAENIPDNSHLSFDFLLPLSYFDSLSEEARAATGFDSFVNTWDNDMVFSYIKLREGSGQKELESQLEEFVFRHQGQEKAANLNLNLMPLTDIYLKSDLENEQFNNSGDIRYVYLFSIIAILILVIACINFMNLSTARSAERAKEVGLRKVMGGSRHHLTWQFLGESIFLSLLAMILALGLISGLQPFLESLMGKNISLSITSNPELVGLLFGISILAGLLSGIYPAFVLSSYKPINVLKGTIFTSYTKNSVLFRKGLVVTQFLASGVLLACTLIVFNQLSYFGDKNLGFEKEQVVVVPVNDRSLRQKADLVVEEFERIPGVLAANPSGFVPGSQLMGSTPFLTEDDANIDEAASLQMLPTYYNLIETWQLELKEGRFFSKEYPSDADRAFVINESAAKTLGYENPIGQSLEWMMPGPGGGFQSMRKGEIVGVVKDFHYQSLHNQIEPLVMMIWPLFYWNIAVRVETDNVQETLSGLENTWNRLSTNGILFEFNFLDQQYDNLYEAEVATGRLFSVFAGLALLIACLGLFGLSSFIIQQKTKEIGIRKVLGAGIMNVVTNVSTGFLKPVAIGFLLSIPIAWFSMNAWLQNFAYRIDIGFGTFSIVGLAMAVIAILAVSYHTLKAATMNPVKAIKDE